MFKPILLASVFFAGFFSAATSPTYGQQPKDRNAIQETIVAFQQSHDIPGISVAIGVGDEIFMSGGFGKADLENGVPAKAETVYRTASIAKPITAVAIMQLVERGKIGLQHRYKCGPVCETHRPVFVRPSRWSLAQTQLGAARQRMGSE